MSDFLQPHGGAHQVPLSMGFSQARIIYVHAQSLSCVQIFVIPWTVSHQAPLSMGFSRQGYWSGVNCHLLLQGIFLTKESNLGLLHCRKILYHQATREEFCILCLYKCLNVSFIERIFLTFSLLKQV